MYIVINKITGNLLNGLNGNSKTPRMYKNKGEAIRALDLYKEYIGQQIEEDIITIKGLESDIEHNNRLIDTRQELLEELMFLPYIVVEQKVRKVNQELDDLLYNNQRCRENMGSLKRSITRHSKMDEVGYEIKSI